MKKTTRYCLACGLLIILAEFFIFGLGYLSSIKTGSTSAENWLFMFACFFIVLLNMFGLLTISLSAKEFKEKKWISWLSCILSFLFWCYYLVIVVKKPTPQGITHLCLIVFALILYIIGIKKKVIDNKMEYKDQNSENQNKELKK